MQIDIYGIQLDTDGREDIFNINVQKEDAEKIISRLTKKTLYETSAEAYKVLRGRGLTVTQALIVLERVKSLIMLGTEL